LYLSAFWSGGLSLATAAPVIATALGGLGPALFLGAGAVITLVGPFAVIGGALHKTIQGWQETTFPYTIWGQSNDFLVVEGKIPLKPMWIDDPDHAGQKKLGGWEEDEDVLKNSPIKFAEIHGKRTTSDKMNEGEFDYLRKMGAIYQVKHVLRDYQLVLPGQTTPVPFKEGEFTDSTQAVVRMNLTAGGGPSRTIRAHDNGPSLDVSRIYWIKLRPTGSSRDNDKASENRRSVLMAGADEGDHRVYLKHWVDDEVRSGYSCTCWQFIPTRSHGGGWLIVDRRYVRFLALRGEEVLQYQSNEIDGLVLDANGWATAVSRPETVWQIVEASDGSVVIKQAKGGRDWYVTARTDGGNAIYARTHKDGDVYQSWELEPRELQVWWPLARQRSLEICGKEPQWASGPTTDTRD